MLEFKWTHAEKVVGARLLDQTLHRELCEVLSQAKEMAAAADEASDLWKLENWLRERRRDVWWKRLRGNMQVASGRTFDDATYGLSWSVRPA